MQNSELAEETSSADSIKPDILLSSQMSPT